MQSARSNGSMRVRTCPANDTAGVQAECSQAALRRSWTRSITVLECSPALRMCYPEPGPTGTTNPARSDPHPARLAAVSERSPPRCRTLRAHA
eukprot:352428-Chlamydomonas_euryale.AAC.9